MENKEMNGRVRLLVVDDDPGVVDYLGEMLEERGYSVAGETCSQRALERCIQESFDLLIADVEMPGLRGIDLLAAVQAKKPGQLVLLITAFGSIELAVQAVRAGACDFVAKPFRIEVLCLAVERALRERRMRREIVRLRSSRAAAAPGGIVADSPVMQRAVLLAERAASSEATVLLTGESGTGKGLLARHIHDRSARAPGPYIQVNCSAIPQALVESELFGVRKGAFTDARTDRTGLIAQAEGGTLFLDEIAEMPLESQPKLLVFLETGRYRPLGASGETESSLRVIAASNRSLEDALRQRQFRPDLYYRLNVIRIEVPPLRERQEDLEGLVDALLERAGKRLGRTLLGVTAEGIRWLRMHPWPGNVRELANILERAVALTEHDTLGVDDLVSAAGPPGQGNFLEGAAEQGLSLAAMELAYIRRVVEASGGNKALAARVLGIDRRTLYRRLEELERGGM